MVKALLFTYQPNRVARKASDVLGADWQYQTQVKKHRIFSRVVTAFLGAGIPSVTP